MEPITITRESQDDKLAVYRLDILTDIQRARIHNGPLYALDYTDHKYDSLAEVYGHKVANLLHQLLTRLEVGSVTVLPLYMIIEVDQYMYSEGTRLDFTWEVIDDVVQSTVQVQWRAKTTVEVTENDYVL